jgi:hypothetical protein
MHAVGSELEYAEVFVQFVKVLGLSGEGASERQHQETYDRSFHKL